MDFRALLIELLGLDSEADDAAIEAALKAKMTAQSDTVQSEHSQHLLQHPTVMALQSQLTAVTTQLNTLQETGRRSAATAFVDAAIAAGRVGVKPMRDEYISLHMENPARAEQLIGAMPALGGTGVVEGAADAAKPGALTQADRQVIALMGLSEDEYRTRLEAIGLQKEAL